MGLASPSSFEDLSIHTSRFSRIEYACLIFVIRNNSLFSKLEKVQNASLRLCLGARISTSISVLHAEVCEPPFKIRFKYLANKFVANVLLFSEHPLAKKLDELALLSCSNHNRSFVDTKFPRLAFYEQLRVRRSDICFVITFRIHGSLGSYILDLETDDPLGTGS